MMPKRCFMQLEQLVAALALMHALKLSYATAVSSGLLP